MSGMIKVKNPAEPTFVPNKLVQSFNPDEYYATQSHFDAVCGTSEVKLFSAQASKTYQYSQVSDYHEKKDQFCPNMNFLCEKDDNPQFSRCMEAIDCKVFLPLKTFLH